ncbi:right-handed parallel beta-helix repeat-containing protein [Parasediminibacterium sp. JCM 36343]|uniref:right-handed parallel beta-helix repeat-containing protein n=1 Tax=Parasediminibacterium sp. JCM 36343 TaxID=3374279 RepID=UPI00397A2641
MIKIISKTFLGLAFCIALANCNKIDTNAPATTARGRMNVTLSTPTTWFVAPDGVTGNTGLSETSPKPLREVGAQLARPGDIINVMSTHGVYKGTGGVILTTSYVDAGGNTINNSGTSGSPITFKGYPAGTKPILVGSTNNWNVVGLSGASYIDIDGLEITDVKTGLYGSPTLTQAGADDVALRARNYYTAHGNSLSGFVFSASDVAYQTNGFAAENYCHHINVKNCYVHDMPGVGIGAKNFDYITIANNTVVNCAEYSIYGTSGISTIYAYNFDNHASNTKPVLISNNVCYGNRVLTNCYTSGALTDGNGIISDVSLQASGNANGDYLGNIRIENNISFNNGGAGINITGGQNVYVVNNTTCNNGLVPQVNYPELSMTNYCKNIFITNNIFYARNDGRPYRTNVQQHNSSEIIKFDFNLFYPFSTTYYGGTTAIAAYVPNSYNIFGSSTPSATHNIVANPIFSGAPPPTTLPAKPASGTPPVPLTNLTLQSTSPARDTGYSATPYYTYFDYTNWYKSDGKTDLGAFEYH